MKLKKEIIMITLVIIMLFAVSSVYAADSEIHTIDAQNSTDEVVSAVNDDDLKIDEADEVPVEADDGDEILAEQDESGDLNYTINGNSKTYVELEKDYRGPFNERNGIQINRDNVVIDGKGHTIDCTGENSRMFNILVDGITLKNIKFVGGSSECGGAIYTNKYLTIINCTFMDNQATCGGDNLGGGAIYANDVKLSIYGCTFINNHASSYGGAVGVMGEDSNDCEIFNCTFIDNAAKNCGGAFYSYADINMGNIINSTFINNRASGGDVIYTRADKGFIDKCLFINNTANSMICGQWAEMIISNSIVVNNYGDVLLDLGDDSVIDNNWWGTTADDTENPVISGDTITNYYILNMTVDDDSADITLNNLYDMGSITAHSNYALPSINLTVKAKNVEVADSVVLGTDGKTTIEHAPAGEYQITIEFNGVVLTREVKPSFKWLNNKINSDVSEVSLDQDCTYDSTKDYALTHGIEFAKDMTIDGQGHVIDAKNSSNIFYFDDDTNSYSLTLKNIIFANAVGVNGAAVYFKGNKLEIINCTFTNNKADSQGDAVYVANALSNANMITESLFTENTGSNSIIFINLDSNANLKVDNSIFIKNDAAKNIIATGNVNADYNWWGNTNENNANISKTENVKVNNWLFLKIDAVAAITGDATLSLNNLYDGGQISTYGEYALKPLTFALGGSNATVSVSEITLGDDGRANYQFRMDRAAAALTASHDNVTTSAQLEYVIVDDGSFRALNEIIFFSDDGGVIELTHDYVYCDSDTITDGIVIPRKITINGNGHAIDAKGKTRIFLIPEGVSHVSVNNICFTNAKASYGSVIVINKDSNYFNMSNCNFTGNVATDYGGVIDGVGDFCTIENCNFINNSAVSKAGVIRYYHDNQAYIKNSKFINNRVADGSNGGGVIYVDDGAVDIDKSVFINNVANDKPGSVLYTSKPATITNSIFLDNPGAYSIYGGSEVKLTNNWFGNTSSDYNSFADAYQTVSGVYHETTLNNWLYLDIKFFDDFAIISLNNAYDKALNSTGVISNYNLPEIALNVNSTTLTLNTNEITLDSTGKAKVYYTKLSDDAKLTASSQYICLTEDVILCDFDILQYLVDENDVIELARDYSYSIEDSVKEGILISRNVTVNGNGHSIDAKEMSRIFNVQASNVTFKNIIFLNGKSTAGNGAAICIKSGEGNFNIENCTFLNNTADGKGGAIYVNAKNAEFNLYDCIFTANKAENDGALYIETDNTEITVDKCLFTKNEAVSSSYASNGNAIVWKSVNDGGNSAVKNSIFLDNGPQKDNGMYTFLLISGDVSIDDNWWGTTAQNHPETFASGYVSGITPNTWLFINSTASSNRLLLNETAKIRYCLQSHNATATADFNNDKLPYIDFDVSCDAGELDKDKVALNEEFTLRITDLGNAGVDIFCNGIEYETYFYGPYMISRSDVPVIIYSNQSLSKSELIKTANDDYVNVTVTCNDSALISVGVNRDVQAKASEGFAKLTFSYGGSDSGYPFPENVDVIVNVVKVPLNISVSNLESREITLTATDTLGLDISFEIDAVHKGYLSAWDTLGAEFDSDIISFSWDNSNRPENGSYYPKGHIIAKAWGTTYLTLYSTSGNFKAENYTVKITVNRIRTDITLGGETSFKVDDTSNINANFYVNGTLNTQAPLIYESSNVSVVDFISNTGDFKAIAKGTAVLTVRFEGNSTHENSSKTVTVTVSKIETQITAEDMVLNATDENVDIGALVNVTGEAHLDYSSSDESVVTVSADGKLTAVGGGQAQVTITYAENAKYLSSVKTITVTVKKVGTEISVVKNPISTRYLETIMINSTVVSVNGVNVDEGILSFFIGNKQIDNIFTVDRVGEFNITVKYSGTPKYEASELNVTVISDKAENIIAVSVDDTVYPNKVTVKVTASQDDTYTVDINGTLVKVEVKGGEGQNTIALSAGSYSANITGYASPLFYGVTSNDTFTVSKADSSVEIVVLNKPVYVGEAISVKAVVPNGATGNVTFTLVDNRTVNVGEIATFDGLAIGDYIIHAVYHGDNNYKASKEVNVTVSVKYDLNLNVASDSIDYGKDLVVKLSTDSNFTGDVLVKVGKLNQTVHVTDGAGNATFAGLTAAKYVITASFTGDDTFHADSADTTATVKGVEVPASKAFSTNLPANSKSPTFSIKLDKDATGKFTVSVDNGKIVKTAVLKGGSASVTLSNLAVGSHKITVSYSGDGKYAPITKTSTLNIKQPVVKKATKIVGAKKTYKVKTKVKKYTITLKSGKKLLKKVKVTIKVKGKTFKATTNSKGKAIFKITNLKKKGKFTAVIKFAGNKNYKPSSKKVTITVKK